MKKILMTGASGFIGRPLAKRVEELGYSVVTLPKRPMDDQLPLETLEGLEGVIHLAGEPIAALRWTKKKKEQIFLSRVRSTWILSHAILRLKNPPRFFFSASAVGYYGNRGDEILTEESRAGNGFLAHVCEKWEGASLCLKEQGIRVIHGRFGNVLDPSGGMLKKMLPVFKAGLGAQMGNGSQWRSWISRRDLVEAIVWVLFSTSLEGNINCCAPHPVTEKEWFKALSQALHRPALWKLPDSFVQLLFGEMGKELFLFSQRVEPKKLLQSSFAFKDPNLQNFFQASI